MGVDLWNLRFLVEARMRGGAFGELLQVGRQGIHIGKPSYPMADKLLAMADSASPRFAEAVGNATYADEGLFQLLGASAVSATDASAYEGAEIVHDFNEPIASSLHERFDTVFDGGSLEHIFNVPTALANMMNLVRVGGRLLSSIPANNWLGHGFYQFGPELPFRVFTKENGFKLHAVFMPIMSGDDYQLQGIPDTGALGSRGEIGRTATQTGLMFIAQKLEHVVPFARWPQQGDYAAAWGDPEGRHQDLEVLARLSIEPQPSSMPRRVLRRLRCWVTP